MKVIAAVVAMALPAIALADNVFDRPSLIEKVLASRAETEKAKQAELDAIKADPRLRTQEIMRATGYSQCILDNMPGVRNDVAAAAVRAGCSSKNPNPRFDIPREKYTGFWAAYESANDCTADKAKEVGSESAALQIRAVCAYLYP